MKNLGASPNGRPPAQHGLGPDLTGASSDIQPGEAEASPDIHAVIHELFQSRRAARHAQGNVRRNLRLTVAVMLTVAVVGLLGGWRWAAALTATMIPALLLSTRRIVPGSPVPAFQAEPVALSVLGVGVSRSFGPVEYPWEHRPPPKRPATRVDVVNFHVCITLFAVWSLSLWPWAAGAWDGSVVLRGGCALLAAFFVGNCVWQWTHGATAEPENEPGPYGSTVTLSFSLIPGVSHSVGWDSGSIPYEPGPLERWLRMDSSAHRPGLPTRLVGLVTAAIAVVFFMTLALAPDGLSAVEPVLTVVGAAIEALVIGWVLAKAFNRGLRAAKDRDASGVAAAVGYLVLVALLVALLVAITIWTGFFGHFLSTVRRLL